MPEEITELIALIEAAKVLNCSVFELLDQSTFWRDNALMYNRAKADAEEAIQKKKEAGYNS